jgi:hypothetical protein
MMNMLGICGALCCTSYSRRSFSVPCSVQAIECLKSWVREELVYGVGSDVRTVEKMLRDLSQRALEM